MTKRSTRWRIATGVAALTLAVAAVAGASSTAWADGTSGWAKQSDGWHYQINGVQVVDDFFDVAGKTYYVDSNGLMATGWKKIDGDWYYFNANGSARTGWVKSGNYWYYIHEGLMVTDDYENVTSSGVDNMYWFDSKGHMIAGWGECNGWAVYTDSSGKGVTGLVTNAAGKQYFVQYGRVKTSPGVISAYKNNKVVYYLTSEDGSLYTKAGWHEYDGNWHYVNADGTCYTGWLTLKSGTYFLDPQDGMLYGLSLIDGTWYVFGDNGKLVTDGWYTFDDGTVAYAYSNGKLPLGYAKLPVKDATDGSTAYYYIHQEDDESDDAGMVIDEAFDAGWEKQADSTWRFASSSETHLNDCSMTINGKAYLFDDEGIMVTGNGWKKQDGIWYYLKNDVAQTGWLKVNGSWYFLRSDENGAMNTDWLWCASKNCYYFMASSGKMVTGWYYDDDEEEWLYLNADGTDYYGWIKRDGVWYALWSSEPEYGGTRTIPDLNNGVKGYVLKDDGSLAKGWAKIGSTWYYGNTSNGTLYSGWVTSGDHKYYIDYGQMVTDIDYDPIPNATDKVTYNYAFDSDGKLITGTSTNNSGTTIYADANGVLQSGFKKIDGSWYYLNNYGAVAINVTVGGLTFGYDGKLIVES